MNISKPTLVLACVFALAGCASQKGRNFSVEQAASIVPGKTSKAEVVALLGEPLASQTSTYRKDGAQKDLLNPAVIQRLEYYYSEQNGQEAAVQEKIIPHRFLNVYVMGEQVVGAVRSSSFSKDSTAFDAIKASSLKKGVTTQQEVFALLGQPSGKSVYPMTHTAGGESWFYQQNVMDLGNRTNEYKRLVVSFSEDKRVVDFSLGVENQDRPMAPTPVIIPIVVPARK